MKDVLDRLLADPDADVGADVQEPIGDVDVDDQEASSDAGAELLADPDEADADVGDGQLEDVVDRAAREWFGATVPERRQAAQAALQWLREDGGPASASDFKNHLLPAHGVTGQTEDTWWTSTVRPALQLALDRDLVEYRHGRHQYTWTGDA